MKSEEPRLRDGALGGFPRALLDSADSDAPPADLEARLLGAIALGSAGAASTAVAPKAATAWWKIGAGVLVAGALGGALWLARRERSNAGAPVSPMRQEIAATPSMTPTPPVAATATAEIEGPAATASVAPSSSAPVVVKDAPAKASAGPKASELEEIQAARAALVAHEPARALQLLQRYSMDYPSGTFGEEAIVMRVQALMDSGRTAQARTEGRAYLARHPKGIYAKRVSSIIGDG